MKRLTLLLALIFALFSSASALVDAGGKAPEFSVRSGDGSIVTLRKLEGAVVTIFYEAKDKAIVETNRHLKDELNRFYAEQTDAVKAKISRIAIIDCRATSWPFKGIWEGNLRDNSKAEGITVYGDWDGGFAEKYQVVAGETNFIIIDKRGIVRYARKGRIEKAEIAEIKDILTTWAVSDQ